MSSNPPRRNYTGDEKMAILREALLEKASISDVCQKHGITPGMFYEWQKKLFEQGSGRPAHLPTDLIGRAGRRKCLGKYIRPSGV